ncbi:MAG: hypothetical protein Q7S53_02195 [bacterium]|nr:hypothetical protein [bacterium]
MKENLEISHEEIGEENITDTLVEEDIGESLLDIDEDQDFMMGVEGAPIEPGDTFDAEKELGSILRAQTEERSALLKRFKERLSYQKEGLADMQMNFVETIFENPDISRRELYDIAGEYKEKYGLTPDQAAIVMALVDKYASIHSDLKVVREEYPTGADFFKGFTGEYPEGEVEWVDNPIALHLSLKNINDYAKARGDKVKNCKTYPACLSRHEITSVRDRPPFMCKLPFVLDNLDEEKTLPEWMEEVTVHEYQHVLYRIFNMAEITEAYGHIAGRENLASLDSEKKLRRVLSQDKAFAEGLAKNELIAYLKNNGDLKRAYRMLKQTDERNIVQKMFMKRGPAYDFSVHNYMTDDDIKDLPMADRLKSRNIKKKIFTKELDDAIWKGVLSVHSLTESLGYTQDKALALLSPEPLAKWPKVVKRMCESQDE